MKKMYAKVIAIALSLLMVASMLASCAGPQGEQGLQGLQGPQGVQGLHVRYERL